MNIDRNDAIESVLAGVLYRASCPAAERLLQYGLGTLSSAENNTIQSHLHDCPHCADEITLLAFAPAAEASSWIERARAWVSGLVEDVTGLISAENETPTQLAFAVKGDTNNTPQIFSGGSYRISLSVRGDGLQTSGRRIEGSVVDTQDPLAALDGKVYVTNTDSDTRSEPLDDFGFFVIDDLPAATYTLLFMLPERSVWIESFTIEN